MTTHSTSQSAVRVRFAPSPTGYLHVGGARTAIFNWLFARHHQGTFILRIEDTDRSRYDEEALKSLLEDLHWLGLSWDEGPDAGGPFTPYYQSERLALYHEHAQILIDKDAAYPCFCDAERLEKVREQQQLNKQQTGYDKHCRNISKPEALERMKQEKYVIRLKCPMDGVTQFKDEIRGKIEYQNSTLDDLVLIKSDGYPTYHMANVVDDHHMQISHVLRGDEWIASTPRHVILYNAFAWTPPKFVHLPVILAEGGGKLSKRKGAASVGDYRELGYLPEVMVNFLSLLGWNPGDDTEYMERDELIRRFDSKQISPKSAAFDEKKLEWLNGQYFLKRSPEFFLALVKPLYLEAGISESDLNDAYLLQVITLLKDRSRRLGDFVLNGKFFFVDPIEFEVEAAKKHFHEDSAKRLEKISEQIDKLPENEFTLDKLESLYRQLAEELQIKAALLIHPTRLALCGISFGPGLFELMVVLGKENVLRRLKSTILKIRSSKPQ